MLTMVRIAARECQTCALPLWGPRLRMACPLRPLYSQWRVANCPCWTSRHASYQRIPTLRRSSRFLLRYLFESSLTSSRFLGITDQCAWESLSSLETICEITNGDIPWLRDLGVASARCFLAADSSPTTPPLPRAARCQEYRAAFLRLPVLPFRTKLISISRGGSSE